jgi:hypothetical protein
LVFALIVVVNEDKKCFKFSEPVGSVSPKINTGEALKLLKEKSGDALNLLCPAQAYPTPVFRLVGH